MLAGLFGQVDTITEGELPARAELLSLFEDTAVFVDTALAEVFDEQADELIGLTRSKDADHRPYLSLSPAKAPDLLRRLKALGTDRVLAAVAEERTRAVADEAQTVGDDVLRVGAGVETAA
ncbi:hypothetical protein [Streptomyces sp. NPDC048496]|uniref:hypothetical protein n=1 Tax=Streptomyces sp. NPDC048496 TaxID=3365558 RepID=UPI003724BA41